MSEEPPPEWAPLEVQQLYWDKLLSAEGMPREPRRKQRRGPRGTAGRNKTTWREAPAGAEEDTHNFVPNISDTFHRRTQWAWFYGQPMQPDTPENEYQALMEADPLEEPAASHEEWGPVGDLIAAAIDKLPEPCKSVFTLWSSGYSTRRSLAEELGISQRQVMNAMAEARAMLAILLEDHPEILKHLKGDA